MSAGPKGKAPSIRPVVLTRRAPASLLSLLLAILSVTAGLAGPYFAKKLGLMQFGTTRPVMSTLLTQAVSPVALGEIGPVARAETGASHLDGYEHLRVQYSVIRLDSGVLEIEAQLADRSSGEILERFVTWRRR
ncbi:MAG: hypothetical protein CSA62_05880 [Planctomycetota bacterium]|nr:MAG: hypothetical protein CSA62_05880 [Planctomycetota bacterium]